MTQRSCFGNRNRRAVTILGAVVAGLLPAFAIAAPTAAAAGLGPPNTWIPTGQMHAARTGQTATLLPDGRVLVAGGGTATAELYDPSTGKFAATGSMVQARVSQTATLLSSGKVLVAGGIGPPGPTVLAEAELYDPATGSFKQTLGNLTTARQWHAANLLQDGKVLVFLGL